MSRRRLPSLATLLLFALATSAHASLWAPRPGVALTADDGVAQRLELVDVDLDGFVDIVVPYSSGDDVGGGADAQINRIFINEAGKKFTELFGVFDEPDNAYAIKAGDIDGDGDPDLVVGVNFSGPSYLLIHEGGALIREELLPGDAFSVGDLELGDVDGDLDLDIVVADWGADQPFGDPADPGGPVRLWLNGGDGSFTAAPDAFPIGVEARLSWSFDLELVDIDNDFDLDVVAASRGPGPAKLFINDGAGVFTSKATSALDDKPINFAVTPIDLDGDAFVELVTLQDGGEGCEMQNGGQVCGARNSILRNEGGSFIDATASFWPPGANPPGADLDAASLDVDNDGRPDLLVTGLRLGPADNGSALFGNGGASLTLSVVDPLGAGVNGGVGLMFADFDHDRREDVAVAVRAGAPPNLVLFGGTAPPDHVPEDTSPPAIALFELLPDQLVQGTTRFVRARVHDHKTPTRWHDFKHEPELATLNVVDGAPIAHRRRLPYIEFALGLDDPAELADLPDTGPAKFITPGVWYGESLWSIPVAVPLLDDATTLTYAICAIDAAGNKACVGPFQVMIAGPHADCGDGICDYPLEDPRACSEDCPCNYDGVCAAPESFPFCCDCDGEDCGPGGCGDGFCEALEDPSSCPEDCQLCDNDAICEPGEGNTCCDCIFCESCGDGECAFPEETEQNCPKDCAQICGNCVCEVPETLATCASDCGGSNVCGCGDKFCSALEDEDSCPTDCKTTVCGDGTCEGREGVADCPEDCDNPATGGSDTEEFGCGCRDAPASGALALLLLLARRRRLSKGAGSAAPR